MGIVDEDIARVREATDTAAVIGEQVALKRVGNRLVGLCPFHTEKSPSFSVNAAEGLYFCFGCQARGDVITFVRETQHLDFAGAVETLAARAGIQLRYDTPGASREHARRGALTEAMEAAVAWYHERLVKAPDAGAARRYLRHERGYDADTVRAFRLGWAHEAWDEMCRALHLPAEVLHDAGLAVRSRNGNQIDAFRGRIVFPIFEADGKPVALGGRVLPGGQGPKYKNSQEGPLYSKRRVLYGLNWAKADVVRSGEVIVCEGYTDVIAFHRAGVPRAVATCGTALADEHMAKLKNFARRIILAYDADAAGQGAAERFYAWEQKLDLDIHVLALPPGTDPGELGTRDPAALVEAVAKARPFLAFRLDRLREAADLSTPEGRSRYSERALEAIAAHPSDLTRDQYVMEVADWARVPADRLRARLDEVRRHPPAERPAERQGRRSTGRDPDASRDRDAGRRPGPAGGRPSAPDGDPGPTDPGPGRRQHDPAGLGPGDRVAGNRAASGRGARPGTGAGLDERRPTDASRPRGSSGPRPAGPAVELEALRLAIHRPEAVAHLLEELLFDDAWHLAAFQALLAAPTLTEAIDGADPETAMLLHRLAVEEPDPTAEPDDVLAQLVRLAALRALAGIEADVRLNPRAVNLTWIKQHIEALADSERRVEAAAQLVAWMSGAGEEGG
ncbi:MAG TPA: DNA primase [Acidimicrobiales bacterium]